MRKFIPFIFFCGILLLSACKKVPDYVISENDMAELLADIHEANAVIEINPAAYNNDSLKKELKQSVFIRHNTTQEQFDTSLLWYGHNLDIYTEVYDNVIEILEERQKNIQKETLEAGENLIATGDSVDIWTKPHCLLFDRFNQGQPILLTYDFTTGSESKQGDRYTWRLRPLNAKNNTELFIAVDYADGTSEFQTKHALPEMLTDIVLQTDSNRVAQRIYGYMEYTPQTESAVVFDKITLTRTRLDSERYNIHPYQRKTKWRQ